MKIPFNIIDFLDRAEHVYGDRIGVVDEPDQPWAWSAATAWRSCRTTAPGCSSRSSRSPVTAGSSYRSTFGSTPTRSPTSSSIRALLLVDPDSTRRWPM